MVEIYPIQFVLAVYCSEARGRHRGGGEVSLSLIRRWLLTMAATGGYYMGLFVWWVGLSRASDTPVFSSCGIVRRFEATIEAVARLHSR